MTIYIIYKSAQQAFLPNFEKKKYLEKHLHHIHASAYICSQKHGLRGIVETLYYV